MDGNNGSAATGSAHLRRAEELIRSLAGVLSATVRGGPAGEIVEIRVAAGAGIAPLQIVRNVQSALLARFGLRVDARAIVVTRAEAAASQLQGNGAAPPGPAPAATPGRPSVRVLSRPDPRLRLHQIDLERRHPGRVRCHVVLALEDTLFSGEAEGMDAAGTSLDVAARAALDAVRAAAGLGPDDAVLELDGVAPVEIGGRDHVVAAVQARQGRVIKVLAGAAAVDDSAEQAAALATLQATNRWIGGKLWKSLGSRSSATPH